MFSKRYTLGKIYWRVKEHEPSELFTTVTFTIKCYSPKNLGIHFLHWTNISWLSYLAPNLFIHLFYFEDKNYRLIPMLVFILFFLPSFILISSVHFIFLYIHIIYMCIVFQYKIFFSSQFIIPVRDHVPIKRGILVQTFLYSGNQYKAEWLLSFS